MDVSLIYIYIYIYNDFYTNNRNVRGRDARQPRNFHVEGLTLDEVTGDYME